MGRLGERGAVCLRSRGATELGEPWYAIGSKAWTMRIANMLRLDFTLSPRGRPAKEAG